MEDSIYTERMTARLNLRYYTKETTRLTRWATWLRLKGFVLLLLSGAIILAPQASWAPALQAVLLGVILGGSFFYRKIEGDLHYHRTQNIHWNLYRYEVERIQRMSADPAQVQALPAAFEQLMAVKSQICAGELSPNRRLLQECQDEIMQEDGLTYDAPTGVPHP